MSCMYESFACCHISNLSIAQLLQFVHVTSYNTCKLKIKIILVKRSRALSPHLSIRSPTLSIILISS
jgi:hypothetical protein